jgi:hypothetical protein
MKNLLFLLTISLALFACSKDGHEDEEETPDFDITADYYFAAVIDGEKVLFQHGIGGHANGTSAGGGTTPEGYQQEQGMIFTKGLSPNNSAGAIILETFAERPWECAQLDQMYRTGRYDFGTVSLSTNTNGEDGVAVYYVDRDGVYWATDLPPSKQNGSSFTITAYNDFAGAYTSKVMEAKFKCVLYDANGNSKKLTKGEIRSLCLDCSSF